MGKLIGLRSLRPPVLSGRLAPRPQQILKKGLGAEAGSKTMPILKNNFDASLNSRYQRDS